MLFSFIYIVYESFYDAKFEPAYWLATITCACQVAVLNHVPVLIIHIFFIIFWKITPFRPHHIFYVLRFDLNKMTDAEAPRLAALVPRQPH